MTLDLYNTGLMRRKRRMAASLRWWAARQMLTINCARVGGRCPETAIPLRHLAAHAERYDAMLRYAQACCGVDWQLQGVERVRRDAQRLECLIVQTPDERRHRLWFDVTP